MKKIFLILISFILTSQFCIARESITKEEHKTLEKLNSVGIVHDINRRNGWQLNEPISAIDAFSLTIKTKSEIEKVYINDLNKKVNDLEKKHQQDVLIGLILIIFSIFI